MGYGNSYQSGFDMQSDKMMDNDGSKCNTYKNNGCGDYQCCNQVEESCQYVDVPHYVNYHTHNIMNIYKRHYIVPTCSQSCEVRVYDVNMPNQGFNNGPDFNNFFIPFR